MLANQFTLSSSCPNYQPRFVNVILPIQTRLLRNAMSHMTPIDPDLNQAFSINELLSAINDTKNTTPGPDNICYEMLKHMSITSLEVLLQLFNKIWFTGNILPSWLHSIVVPIRKPNKPTHLPSSYRPISLTSNVCKLFEKMIVCRLNWFLNIIMSPSPWRNPQVHGEQTHVLSVFIDIEGLRHGEQRFFYPSCLAMAFQVECFTSSAHLFRIEPFKYALDLLYQWLNA